MNARRRRIARARRAGRITHTPASITVAGRPALVWPDHPLATPAVKIDPWDVTRLERAAAHDLVATGATVRGFLDAPPRGARSYSIRSYPSGSSSGAGVVAVRTPFGDAVVEAETLNGVTSLAPVSSWRRASAVEMARETGLPMLFEVPFLDRFTAEQRALPRSDWGAPALAEYALAAP